MSLIRIEQTVVPLINSGWEILCIYGLKYFPTVCLLWFTQNYVWHSVWMISIQLLQTSKWVLESGTSKCFVKYAIWSFSSKLWKHSCNVSINFVLKLRLKVKVKKINNTWNFVTACSISECHLTGFLAMGNYLRRLIFRPHFAPNIVQICLWNRRIFHGFVPNYFSQIPAQKSFYQFWIGKGKLQVTLD